MRDLLGQVKDVRAGFEDVEVGQVNGVANENSGGGGGGDMGDFFFQVSQIKNKLGEIDQTHGQLVELHERSKTVTRSEDMKKVREQMQHDTERVKKLGHAVKGLLDTLDNMNQEALKRPGQQEGSSSERTRTSISAGLKKKLKDQMDKFQKLRSLIQAEYREVVERRVYTVTGQRGSEDEIDRLIENGQSDQLFRQAILSGNKVADTVAEIEELNSMNTITKFVSREVDGYVAPVNELTSLPLVEYMLEQGRQLNNPEAPPLPPLSPVVVFAGSSSEGADGILSKNFKSVKELKGQDVYLEVGTISQYFLYRALQESNLTLDDVNMLNSPLEEWVDSYEQGDVDNLIGFNPFLSIAQDIAGGNVLFTSKEMSREIVDVLLVHSQILREHPGFGRALAGAYFEVMDLMYNQSASSEIIQWMGARQNTTAEDFMFDLEFIELFYNPQECVDFIRSESLKKALANSLNYVFDIGLLDDVYSSPLQIGIDVNGDIFGDRSNIKLYFDDIFCANETKKR
eukprot:TRINITY_DN3601_c0_g3_i1.p1 TRINITY_DN3601_c0_g3~~TRINITY_DN3601_c0_g3_i1.p1  ORF type:complete len:514 (-),score=85.42 TRINITY_DN3601_c0_g3_i1:78-1619(-)